MIEVVDEGEDVARCPHCAKELDPPDAIVCVNCGFNNVTRAKAKTKKVWAPTREDWMSHLLPGIIALAICIALIVLDVDQLHSACVSGSKVRSWKWTRRTRPAGSDTSSRRGSSLP